MTTKATKCFIDATNQFAFEMFGSLVKGVKNHQENVAFSPTTLFNALNLIRVCSSDLSRQKLDELLHQDQLVNDSFSQVTMSDVFDSSSEWELIAPEDFLLPSHLDRLLTSEKRLKIVENTSKLSEKLGDLRVDVSNDENRPAVVLGSKTKLSSSWRSEFNETMLKNELSNLPCRKIGIKMMEIPKKL